MYMNPSEIRMQQMQWSIKIWDERFEEITEDMNSHFIELILSKVILPSIYLWEDRKGNYEALINGEILFSILNFKRNQFTFSCKNEFFKNLNGKTFDELPPNYQYRIIASCPIIQVMDARTPIEGKVLIEYLKNFNN